jgi:DNA-binding LytR/AlgR family response regulator
MVDSSSESLKGRCLLVVEDEYLIAAELTASLESLGAEVFGPAASVEEALSLVERNGARLNGAVLDINLRNERVYPVAEVLTARGVPFLFTTGYDAIALPSFYAYAPRCQKPIDTEQIVQWLSNTDRANEECGCHSSEGNEYRRGK